jgi:hypothetical protein
MEKQKILTMPIICRVAAPIIGGVGINILILGSLQNSNFVNK